MYFNRKERKGGAESAKELRVGSWEVNRSIGQLVNWSIVQWFNVSIVQWLMVNGLIV